MKYASYRTAIVVVALMSGPAFADSPDDFVSDAIKGDNSEIMLGRYAAEHAGSPDVKRYGETLASDHAKAKAEMVALAKQVGVTPPDSSTVQAMAERTKLMVLSGHSFDSEFAEYMVKDHQDDIAKFKAEADAKAGPVSQVAAKQLPVLEKHLRLAQSLPKS